jgi:hypothetical protein
MTVFGAIVHARAGPDEHVPDVGELEDFSFGLRITAQLVDDDAARTIGTRGEHVLEGTLRGSFVAKRFQQDVEYGPVLIDGAPQHVWLAAQHDRHFVDLPRVACLWRADLTRRAKPTPNWSHQQQTVS